MENFIIIAFPPWAFWLFIGCLMTHVVLDLLTLLRQKRLRKTLNEVEEMAKDTEFERYFSQYFRRKTDKSKWEKNNGQ